MSRALLVIALSLTTLFTACVVLLRAQPNDDAALRALLLPDAGCAPPCFMGIRAGLTEGGQVRDLLSSHAWVARPPLSIRPINDANTQLYVWDWSGQQPKFVDTFWQGEVRVYKRIVRGVTVHTHIPFGAVWLALGGTRRGVAVFALNRADNRALMYIAVYADSGLLVRFAVPQRATRGDFWSAPVEFESANREALDYYGAYPLPQPCYWICRS